MKLREGAGYASAAAFARSHNLNVTTYQHHENGNRGLTRKQAQAYADLHAVDVRALLYGDTGRDRGNVSISGYIIQDGVAAVDHPIDTSEISEGGALDVQVELPDFENLTAWRVLGNSLYPAYRDGDVIFHGPLAEISDRAPGLHGLECIVELPDGRKLLRQLIAQGDGKYTLIGYSTPPILNQVIMLAAPVEFVKRQTPASRAA